MMQACWVWGIKKKLLPIGAENPWLEIKISLPPRQQPQPFTAEEISKIMREFRGQQELVPR
jgi:integrase